MSKPLRQSCVLPVFSRSLFPLSLSFPIVAHQVCVMCVACCFFYCFFFGVNFFVKFCMLRSRTESSRSFLHFISIPSSISFCFAFADCFVFEKWLSHHFYCIFECLSLSLSIYLSSCACVLGVCHKDLCVAIYTHSQKTKGEKERERGAQKTQSKTFVSRLHRVEYGKASSVGLELWKWRR